jgi:hypothetical protein
MAHVQTLIANPFALMLSPEEVLKAVEGSQLLSGLTRHVCRPLDRPVLGKTEGGAEADTALAEYAERGRAA